MTSDVSDADASRPVRADRGAPAIDWHFTLAVTVVALLPRLFVAIAWAREPVWDGHYYHFGATRIAAGLGYSENVIVDGLSVWKPWCHYPVGYSAGLAALYEVFGESLLVGPIANAVIGALGIALVHRLGLRYLTEQRARIAAGLAALHPGLIAYCALVMNEAVTGVLLLAAFYAVIRWRGSWHGMVLGALVVGVTTLVRPSAILVAPMLALALPPPRLKALAWGVLATLGSTVVVLPWTLRNCRVMDGCAFVSTNGGWNLAIGAITRNGRFTTLEAEDGCPVVTGQVQQDRCWANVGVTRIQADPWGWVALIPKKLGQTWDHESFPIEYLREADPAAWPEARRVAGRGLLTGFHRLLLVAAALSTFAWRFQRKRPFTTPMIVQATGIAAVIGWAGFAFASIHHPFFWLAVLAPLIAVAKLPGAPRQGPVGRTILALIALTSLTHAVFFGDDRYHMVATPALCLLAAAALRRPSETAAIPR